MFDNPNEHICIFEKKYCKYAKRIGQSFECTAATDAEMPCVQEPIHIPHVRAEHAKKFVPRRSMKNERRY